MADSAGRAAKLCLAVGTPLLFLCVTEFLVASFDAAPPVPDPVVVWNQTRQAEIASSAGEFRFHPHPKIKSPRKT